VELAEVRGFDLDRRIVHCDLAGVFPIEISYDSLIVAAGANQSYFGNDQFALYAPGMKTIDDALELRRRIFGAFEMAETVPDPANRADWLTTVIVGAGPTGVELAGQVRELATRCLRGEFRNFKAQDMRVILLDAGSQPLAAFGDELSAKATKAIERMGVTLQMETKVVGIHAQGVDVEDANGQKSQIAAHTVIWAAGVQASPLAGMLAEACGAETDRAGRIAVLPDLTLPGHPEVFCVGDMTTLDRLPGVAEVAMQGGLHAANSILRGLKAQPTLPYKYRDLGNVAALGRFKAIASVKKLQFSGFLGWIVWFFVHLAFLTGFGNRLSTMLRWLRTMIGRGRGEREFSTAHTGGDLSLPDSVRVIVTPNPYPNAAEEV
jgi:NADH:ubiquinone reductase (H+-translocating)